MKKLITLLALMTSIQAAATGGTSCTVNSDDLNLEVGLTNGHYPGNPIVSNSYISLNFKSDRTKELKSQTVTFEKTFEKNEIYSWYHNDGEMRLFTIKEVAANNKNGIAEVALDIKIDTDISEWGTYKVEVMSYGKPETFSGPIHCEFE